jgi:hypothetical protein
LVVNERQFCWNKKCVRDIHLVKFYLFCLPHHRNLLPCSPFPLTLCVLINKKGFDTMRFRHTGKSPRRNVKTKWVGGPICLRFSWRRSDWWAPEARFF